MAGVAFAIYYLGAAYLYGLAPEGVENILPVPENLDNEVDRSLGLPGVPSFNQLGR